MLKILPKPVLSLGSNRSACKWPKLVRAGNFTFCFDLNFAFAFVFFWFCCLSTTNSVP